MFSALFDLKGIMKIVYGKPLTQEENFSVDKIAKKCDILFDTAKLLFYRKIDTPEKALRFLSPGKNGFYEPLLLSGMKEAVDRLYVAKERDENVLIFGDYDADGICAATVLYNCLKEYGIKNIRIFVPEREEGYGLNAETVTRLNAEFPIDLLVTVDCGISDCDKIEAFKKSGIDVIVTDHHEPPEILPDCIKINPKLKGQKYPFGGLCGAGVAYKLGYALISDKADVYLDFVALATVADSMELVGENRDIVSEGLKLFNKPSTLRLIFKYLLGEGVKTVTAQTLAYVVAPRVNAGGRMGDANSVLCAFTEIRPDKIFDFAVKLNEYNIARQAECDNIYNEAKEKIKRHSLHKKDVILVKDEKWRAGFIGIVAAKLVEDYSRPVIVFAGHENYLKGSARSVEEINIYDAISSAKELLIGYGGHSQAAGVSVSKENFALLDKALNNFVKSGCGKLETERKLCAEWEIDEPVTIRFAREIDMLEPFGVGNRRPLFTTTINKTDSVPLKSGSAHYSFKTKALEMLDFNGEKNVLPLSMPIDKSVVFEINLSIYRNRESVKGYARAVYPDYGDFSAVKTYVTENEIKRLLSDDVKYTELSAIDKKEIVGNGTLYAVSDPENLKNYPELKSLPTTLFYPEGKGATDCVVVSPAEIPERFDRVIYLDKPLSVCKTEVPVYFASEACGYKFLDLLSVERSDFARIFALLKGLNGKPFKGCADFASRYAEDENQAMFVFATEVFLELKIFTVKNGLFTFDKKVKNALTNSKLYSKIYILKC